MAKDRLELQDKYGNPRPYDVSSEDVTLDNEGGKSLKTKLAEIDNEVGGQVKSVTLNGEAHKAADGVINLGNQMQPNWEESSTSYPSYIRNKPNVVLGIKVGESGQTHTPTNGVVVLPESGGTVVCDTAMSGTSENPVQNKVIKAYVDAAVLTLQNALNALTSGDTTTAIENFQEVIDFLDGVTDDETLIGKITALQTAINGKQPMLTFDNAPTAGSNNPVKSGGVKTALDAKVNTETGKGLSSNDYTTAEKTKLQNLPTNPVTSISVNGQTPQTPTEGNVNIEVGSGSVDSVTINGTKHTPDANGDVDLGTIVGQKGDKGDTGNCTITDAGQMVSEIVNDLTTGGADKFLSAEMGKRLKQKIEDVQANILKLYNNLGNIAFWDAAAKAAAAPTALDWGNPKHTVALDLDLTNAVVTYNGTPVSDGDTTLVEEGTTARFIVSPQQSGDVLALPTASAGGSSIAPVNNGNGTYTIALTMGQSDVTLAITAAPVPKATLTVVNNITNAKVYHEGSEVTSGIEVNQGDTVVLTVEGDTGYDVASVTAQGATSVDNGDGTFTVSVVVSATMTLTINGTTMAGLLVNNSSLVYNTSGSECFMYTDNSARNQKRLVVCLRDAVSNPTTWAGGGAGYHDAAKDALYSLPVIPSGATGIKVTFTNDNLDSAVGLVSSDSKQVYTTGWKTFAEQPSKELVLSSYPTAFYYVILFRVKNNGSFTNADDCMTVEELGFTLEFTYA